MTVKEFEVLEDGVHYEYAIGEYVIILNGDVIGYNEDEGKAYRRYNQALSTNREHVTRNPANEITQANFYGVMR